MRLKAVKSDDSLFSLPCVIVYLLPINAGWCARTERNRKLCTIASPKTAGGIVYARQLV
jgi:hypothetical protein